MIDWRGNAKPIDDELVPTDLRIDHVYLVSCTYLSKVVGNAAPRRHPARRPRWPHAARVRRAGLFDGLLRVRWPAACAMPWQELAAAVSARSAERLRSSLRTSADEFRLLLRLLRIGPAPYFVLGVGEHGVLRLRVLTSWDWTQRYGLASLEVEAEPGGQPRVGRRAAVRDRDLGRVVEVRGHVEIRWSHGRLNGAPEAKIYLDTPHAEVPGYLPLA